MRRYSRWRSAVVAVTASLVAVTASPIMAAPVAAAPKPASSASEVVKAEQQVARALARSLADTTWRSRVQEAALKSDQVEIAALAKQAPSQLRSSLASADKLINTAKGLQASESLLRLRLGDPSMRSGLTKGATPLVTAAAVQDSARTVIAYDARGVAHELDARKAPAQPVYVIDIDSSRSVAEGLRVLNEELQRHGMSSSAVTKPGSQAQLSAGAAGIWTTKINQVYLTNDEEPWVKGDAEIYTLVAGFGHDGKVRIDTVDMPYLDKDGTVYRPNQVLVNWSNYKYNMADAVMMEEDGGINYRDLAKALVAILLTVFDQGMYIPLVNAILDAMPDEWWTDSPDYVDSWYTLSKTDRGTRYGARGNGWMSVEPYFVQRL
ncbi:hypothetical protein ADK75_03750 [Streptomyces virginiae]|uniref:DUF3103 domain-containing protein n=1 Tax=Streptomyces virginiae TaxID=1961 RepID=A0A0L8N4B6_STRVG|nr:DUF3103 family protein [Streptomyces virginiae]KOG57522.1 hypothetical protein ADK75_03750 [Streptomyces virginiae]